MPSDSKDDLVQRALELLKKKPQPPDTTSTIQVGDSISWTRDDGTAHKGSIDCLHTDDAGVRWAFLSIGPTWAAVNLRVAANVKKIGPSPKMK